MAVADILQSGARVFYAPEGEALPSENSVPYGAAWGGNWVNPTYTLEPVTIKFERTVGPITVEQSTLPLDALVTEESIEIETTLAEVTGANLNLALDGTLTTTAAGPSQAPKEEVEAGGNALLTKRAWGFEGLYRKSDGTQLSVRVFVYRGAAVLGGELKFSKKDPLGVPLQITAYADVTKVAGKQGLKIQKVTGVHT
jgi:hypothetical protein